MLRKSLNVVESQYQPSDKTSLWLKRDINGCSLYYNDGIDWKPLSMQGGGTSDDSHIDVVDISVEKSVSVSCDSKRVYTSDSLQSIAINAVKSEASKTGVNEIFQFTTGDNVNITVDGVVWANGDTPTFENNKTYEIHIMYNNILDKFLGTYAIYE